MIDETGNRHGRLTAIEQVQHKKGKRVRWKCLCDCGNITEVDGTLLRNGNTKSCGCYKTDSMRSHPRNIKNKGEAAFNYLYINYKINASERDLAWELEKEIFRELTIGRCYYCGVEPNQKISYKRYNGDYSYNGVDRLDNSIGYVVGNVVPCCGQCNRMKGRLSGDEFMRHIKRIISHQECGSRATSNMDISQPHGKEGSPL